MNNAKTVCRMAVAGLLLGMASAQAAEVGHFAPGPMGIRDFAMPAPGLYGAVYNFFYTTDRLNDANGSEVDSVTVGPPPGVELDLDVDVDFFAIAPTVIWVSEKKFLGAKVGALAVLNIGDSSLSASLSSATGSGRNAEGSNFNIGDLFLQPVWLCWTKEHWDLVVAYGYYAPIGDYDTETITLPVVGDVMVEAADNIGLGFGTHQLQTAATWYPWVDRRMAVNGTLTYEMNENKDDFDLTPGDVLTLNWGADQYLPVKSNPNLLLDVGVSGYSSWQVSDDTGANAAAVPLKDEVHAVGIQLGLTHIPKNAALTFRYMYEFDSEDRFQGQSIGLNFAIKF